MHYSSIETDTLETMNCVNALGPLAKPLIDAAMTIVMRLRLRHGRLTQGILLDYYNDESRAYECDIWPDGPPKRHGFKLIEIALYLVRFDHKEI